MKTAAIIACVLFAAVDLLLLSIVFTGQPDWFFAKRPPRNLDEVGVQPGQQMSQVPLVPAVEKDGTADRDVSAFWEGKPAVIMTASMTCPLARKNLEGLERLRADFGDRVNFGIIYLIEAHPDDVPSPYDHDVNEPWITDLNENAGILRAQPTTLAERRRLATEFADLPKCEVPVWVDHMDNRFWAFIGRASNLGLVIDVDGTVLARTGWFDEEKLRAALVRLSDQRSDVSN
jgi:hypothetical protein